jgi:hypothetical protein
MEAKEKLLNLATSLGLTCHQVAEVPVHMYDGQGNIYYTDYGNHVACTETKRVSNLAHEIAHWLVADPERRNLPEFGLGSGPETAERTLPHPELTRELRNNEEGYASILGMLLEHWAGQDPNTFTFEEHGWGPTILSKDLPDFKSKFSHLIIEDPKGFYRLRYNENH